MDRVEGLPINSEKNEPLIKDLTTVENNRGKTISITQKIHAFTATPIEIREWYFAKDPLDELQHLVLLASIATGNNEAAQGYLSLKDNERYTYEAAAAGFVASVYIPHAFTGNPFTTYEQFEAEMSKHPPDKSFVVSNQKAPISVDDIVNISLHPANNKVLTDDELERIYMAAEMLTTAVSIGASIGGKTYPHTREAIDLYLSNKLYTRVMANAFGTESSLDRKLVGVDAQWSLAATMLSTTKDETSHATKAGKILLWSSMVSHLSHIFTPKENNPLQSERKNEMRGKLHELLWFLDASLYNHLESLSHIVVYPSHSHQDTPHVGRPEATRGFDFFLFDKKTKGNLAIQLKSRPQEHFKKPYHPLITPVHETNFQDVNPKRLNAKLDAYWRYIKSGCDPAMEAGVRKYLLPSVVETISSFSKQNTSMLEQVNQVYDLGATIHIPRSRQERRRVERELAKSERQRQQMIKKQLKEYRS